MEPKIVKMRCDRTILHLLRGSGRSKDTKILFGRWIVQSSKYQDDDNVHTGHCCLSYREKKWDGECEGDVHYDQGVEQGHSEHQHGGYQIDQVIEAQGQHQPFIIKLFKNILA